MSDYVSATGFSDLPLSDELRRGIAERGYTQPTPVQSAVFQPIASGRDVICRSKTGTGKTAAFGIPLIERIPAGARKVRALALCNTRELALQVSQELSALAKYKDLSVVAIYGGAPMGAQTDALARGAEIVVGTPGRVFDHIQRGTLKLGDCKIAVLDEADEMLSSGFFEEVTRILDRLPSDRQTLLFSATVPPDIEQLVQKYLREPETILLSGDVFTVDHLENVIYYVVDQYPKPRNLLYLLEREDPESAIVFCNTRTDTSLITAVLNRNGLDAELLNGELPQKERERVMAKVKRGELKFMVATDIAARGIDISDLTHVINYSLPEDPAVYLHRVGRTGRMSKKGTAISLVSGAELVTLTALERKYGVKFETRKLPTPEEAKSVWAEKQIREIREAMGESAAFEAFIPLAQDMAATEDGRLLLAYLLKYFFTHHRMEKAQAKAAPQQRVEESHAVEQVQREQREERKRGRGGRRGERREGEHERRPGGPTAEGASAAGDPPVATHDRAAASGSAAPADGAAPASAPAEPRPDTARLFVGQGQEQGWDGPALTQALLELTGQPRETILSVEVRLRHAFVTVPAAAAAGFLIATGRPLKEKPVNIEIARRR